MRDRYSKKLSKSPKSELDRRAAAAASTQPAQRAQTEDLIDQMEAWLQVQWDGKTSTAQTTFSGWQAKRLNALIVDMLHLTHARYEISSEQSYSSAKKAAGRKPGDDVAENASDWTLT